MKKISVSWLKAKGIELAVGDVVNYCQWNNYSITFDDIDNPSYEPENCFLTSFADRPNTGKQPVGDDVIVDYTIANRVCDIKPQPAKFLDWSTDIESYHPNFDALYDIYTKETAMQKPAPKPECYAQADDKPEINAATALYAFAGWLTSLKEPLTFSEKHWATPAADMVASFIELNQLKGKIDFDKVKTPSDSVIPSETVNSVESISDDKPVFTQAMADNGGLPYVGVDCRYKLKGGVNWFDCRVIHYHKNHAWIENLTTGSSPLVKINTLLFGPVNTDEQNLRDEMSKFMVSNFNGGIKCLAKNILESDKFTIKLNGDK